MFVSDQARQGKEPLLFLKKKKQKDFRFLWGWTTPSPQPTRIKSFLVTFFQKSNFFLLAPL
jgi:hypothetical protein